MLYDITNRDLDESKNGLGVGDQCDGPKWLLNVGKNGAVKVEFTGEDGELLDLSKEPFGEGVYNLMADIGTTVIYKPVPANGFVSKRAIVTDKIAANDAGKTHNFFFAPEEKQPAAPAGQPDETAYAFGKEDPFEVDVIDRLSRIETKLDRLLGAKNG